MGRRAISTPPATPRLLSRNTGLRLARANVPCSLALQYGDSPHGEHENGNDDRVRALGLPFSDPDLAAQEAVSFAPWRNHASLHTHSIDTVLEAINVTNLASAFAHLVSREVAIIIAELSIHKAFQEGWKRKARAQGFRLHLSPTDPEASVNERAGVGLLPPAILRHGHAGRLPLLCQSGCVG